MHTFWIPSRFASLVLVAGALQCAPTTGHPTQPTPATDPAVTDPDKYRVVLENERVRVLRYRDQPGDKTHPHHHPEFVLYALSTFERRLTFGDGTKKERTFSPGDVIWMPEQSHVGENIGSTVTDVLIVELKDRGPVGRPTSME
jgi:quercetin dioxygenase-like cupin family protein